jgi:hypothetical protein
MEPARRCTTRLPRRMVVVAYSSSLALTLLAAHFSCAQPSELSLIFD